MAFTDPHSDILRVTGELGLVGIFFFIGILLTSARKIYATYHFGKDEEIRFLTIIVTALFVYFVINGLFSSFIWRKSYWFVIGLAAAVPHVMSYSKFTNNNVECS